MDDWTFTLVWLVCGSAVAFLVVKLSSKKRPSGGALAHRTRADLSSTFRATEGWNHWIVDLSAMRAWSEIHHPRLGPRGNIEHHIRRLAPLRWEMRVTDLAWAQYSLDLEEGAMLNEGPVRIRSLVELENRKGGPQWLPFGEWMCGALEAKYDGFVREQARIQQGRGFR